MKYGVWRLVREGLRNHRGWQPAWRKAQPRHLYDVVIVGGGGHGLATAYYLAARHGIRNIAVIEKGWIGGGNVARNTTIVRSNYLLGANARFYDFSLQLWETLSDELNFNVMFSQRGVVNLAHSDAQLDVLATRGNAMHSNGIGAELIDAEELQRRISVLNCSSQARFPVIGALVQGRGGTVRHDAVAWGYARAASQLGVDIIENCEVTDFDCSGDRVNLIHTSRGTIAAGKVAIAVAGHTSMIGRLLGLELPIESHVLQAFVTEPVKPVLDTVVSSGAAHCYVSQTDKGEIVIGGDLDFYPSYAQRGNLFRIEEVAAATLQLFPTFSRLRVMRTWAGIMDMSPDGSPIISKTPLTNVYLTGGWCYGGFKATPASGYTLAHTIAHDEPHPLNTPFSLDRFQSGRTIDEKGAGPSHRAH